MRTLSPVNITQVEARASTLYAVLRTELLKLCQGYFIVLSVINAGSACRLEDVPDARCCVTRSKGHSTQLHIQKRLDLMTSRPMALWRIDSKTYLCIFILSPRLLSRSFLLRIYYCVVDSISHRSQARRSAEPRMSTLDSIMGATKIPRTEDRHRCSPFVMTSIHPIHS